MKGILLVNLGSPASPQSGDVKPYLDEFLMDRFVLDVPYPIRALLVRGVILRKRPERSAAAYQRIWTEDGSPLIVISTALRDKVRERVQVPVALGMRYGNPSILSALRELQSHGVSDVLVVPLYPQHAMASTVTVTRRAEDLREQHFPASHFHYLPAFYNRREYVEALSQSIRRQLEGFEWDHLLFSYHGIPERHIRKSDVTHSHCRINNTCCVTPSPAHQFCYRHQCFETTRRVVQLLGVPEGKYSQTFQSRLAGDKWLEPYTDVAVNRLAESGVRNLAVVMPAFVSDCLETLEEIGMEASHQFSARGGKQFRALRCLNDDEAWVSALSKWINEWS